MDTGDFTQYITQALMLKDSSENPNYWLGYLLGLKVFIGELDPVPNISNQGQDYKDGYANGIKGLDPLEFTWL